MSLRQCEVVLKLPNGKQYSAVVRAQSVYDAAVTFYSHCNDAAPELKRPRVDAKAMLEVRPIYQIEMSKALAWAVRPLSREERKARQQR